MIKKAIAFTGYPKTGKTEVSKILCRKHPDTFLEVDLGGYIKHILGGIASLSPADLDAKKQQKIRSLLSGSLLMKNYFDPSYRDVMAEFCRIVEKHYSPAAHVGVAAAKMFSEKEERIPIFTNVYHKEVINYIEELSSELWFYNFYTQREVGDPCPVRDLAWTRGEDFAAYLCCDNLDFESKADFIFKQCQRT